MLSQEPQQTDYDFHFHMLGFPVRVHPLFWLTALVLIASSLYDAEGQLEPDAGVRLLAGVSVIFLSILVHELGHALLMRRFGTPSHIVLYMLGGMAVPDSAYGWRPVRSGESPWAHILVSLAGPLAGFLLALLTAVTIFLLGGRVALQPDFFPYFTYAVPPTVSQPLQYVIGFSLYINIVWGVLNLLPVFPLDGGQIARELLQMVDPGNGLVRSLWLSVYVAAGVAIAGWALLDSIFMGLMFLSLAANNYMILQQIHGGGPGGGRW